MTTQMMEHTEIEKHFRDMMAHISKRNEERSIADMRLDNREKELYLEAENILVELKDIRAAGGAITAVWTRGASEQEIKKVVAEKIRAFRTSSFQGKPSYRRATLVS